MKKVIVPEDIKSIGRKKILSRLIAFEILLVLSAAVLYFADGWLDTVKLENKIFTYIFFLVLPFLISGFPHRLIDSTWSGTVVQTDVRKAMYKDFGRNYFYRSKYMPVLDIIKDKKDFTSETVTNVRITASGYPEMYNPGDKVVHIYGCKYLYVMPKKDDDPVVCVVCGMKNHTHSDKVGSRGACAGCGYSLDIRFEDNKIGRYYR